MKDGVLTKTITEYVARPGQTLKHTTAESYEFQRRQNQNEERY